MTEFSDEPIRVDREMAAKIKGMLGRGDEIEDIAVWFGVNVAMVRAVQTGAVHPFVEPAPASALPPGGPYESARRTYRALKEVSAAERRLFAMAQAERCKYATKESALPRHEDDGKLR